MDHDPNSLEIEKLGFEMTYFQATFLIFVLGFIYIYVELGKI